MRTLIGTLREHIGTEIEISGWIDTARNQGKVAFFDVRDRSGMVQGVVFGKPDVLAIAKELGQQYVVSMTGIVKERDAKQVNEKILNGDIELEITGITILAEAAPLPFDMDADLNLDTLMDYRPLTLRRERERAIFKVQHIIISAYREFLIREGFTEFQSPKLAGNDAEGGAEVFRVEYFDETTASLATSPQLYKQMLVGVFERVFATGSAFRAEKSATTRHMSEIAMLDLEMGFINDYTDVMALVTRLMRHISDAVSKECVRELEFFGIAAPLAPEAFPVYTLREAQELIKRETGADKTNEPDLEPEDERFLSEYAAKHHGSDFVFVTQFPTSKRPFYTYKNQNDPEYTDSFDLLFRGLEMCSGGQRVHDHDQLVTRIKEKGLDPTKFAFYLQAFKYGMPPHGGIGMGLERLTMKMLGLENVKEASLFPRDMNRIDTLLSQEQHDETENDD